MMEYHKEFQWREWSLFNKRTKLESPEFRVLFEEIFGICCFLDATMFAKPTPWTVFFSRCTFVLRHENTDKIQGHFTVIKKWS